ncbi:MAG: T9SS type A sorting domain-containing protein, partial [Crocinitomicaceae bacterium]
TDGGNNWTELTTGLPTTEESRIGLAISNSSPNTLYAIYTDGITLDVKDIYKTTNGGTSWTAMNVAGAGLPAVQGGFGWYFGEVYLNPYNNNQLIVPGVDMWMSNDGGLNWAQNVPDWWTYDVHADKHAILFLGPTSYIIATDGGLYKTTDNGATWTDIENIPVTQFYHIDADPLNPGLYGGGAQDNGTMQGNASVFNMWEKLAGGDGFRLTYLEDDPGGIYYETQNGNLNYANLITWDWYDVSPTVNSPDRVNWDMPYHINETDAELFAGTAEMMMMEAAPFGSYVSISGDLTKVGLGTSIGDDKYHTITEIDQSKFDSDKLYVGTSDGLMWRGDRTGTIWNWTNITGTLPDRYVTAVRVSPNYNNTIYVGMSGYKYNEEVSYLYKSDNNGVTWTDISGNLPGITVNDILVVEGQEDTVLFAALDGGVYYTEDSGINWDYMGTNIPFATISELAMDETNQKLIAGTYSRSMYSYDVSWVGVVEPPTTGIKETSQEVKFYPNPVHDLVYFQDMDAEYLDLYNTNGERVVHKKILNTGQYCQVNIAELPAGVYIFKSGNYTGKVVKE